MLNESLAPSTIHAPKFGRGRTCLVAALAVVMLAVTGCQTLPGTMPGPGLASQGEKQRTGFNNLLQSVVRIDVRELNFDGGSKQFVYGVGSGVILSDDGLILTNAHVVSPRAVEIDVTLASLERVSAKLIGWDHWTDLALLRLDMKDVRKRHLTFSHAIFGDSSTLYPGETVYAVGTPEGLARTVTKGIISNTDRYFETSDGIEGYETGYFNTWLQTDAAINPGNSGGPLVTSDGKVVGINSRTYLGAENLGFAIPINIAKTVVAGLLKNGRIKRSYIGLVPGSMQDLEHFYNVAINTGMLVNGVDSGSPCAKAGIRPGDIVLAINGTKVDGRFPEQLPPIQNMIASMPVGTKVVLTVKRNSHVIKVLMVTERLESRMGEEWAFDQWGLSVRKVSRAYARDNRLPDETGVLVIGTQSAFPADKAGLSSGDIITKVNNKPINSLAELKQIYDNYEKAPKPLLLETLRNQNVSLYVLKP